MPQMAPLMWTSLFLFFITVFMLFLMTNFFMKTYFPKNLTFHKKSILKNWKW
uniref:ATP synthase F0 subunit 8 n=1 Tax=Chrysomeloidea sp. 1 KM-2017 TaxID=2219295 RepID=A0A346RJN4_9CUCU|nr:ATP synthase F0 subunit 8 [Chrysomeloidea sp. 1 KM-2017]